MQSAQFLGLRSITGWITVLALAALVLFGVSTITYERGITKLSREGDIRLELFVTYLRGVLEKYESLPELLARDKQLVNFFLNPGGRERIEALNRYLETINDISNAADTYLMDKDGLTIAASNWQEEHPFVGRNFSYRPYFKQAMKGHLGRYFALGTTSIKRGYYFAYPVRRDNEILGAVVIKINIDNVEKKWGDHDEIFLVTDPDNVIFITTHSDWRYKTLGRVTPLTEDLIRKSKRYPNSDIVAIDYTRVKNYDFGSIINLQDQNNQQKTFLQQVHYMDEAGWNVQILSNISPLRQTIIGVNILVATGFLFSYLLLVLLRQRRQRLSELKRFEDHARRVLQEANEKLETRVGERTRELVETNEKLLREIHDRKNTEAILKRTRSELIHAAKMATLGQMSAGINHELNQPLAAIRSYADNARQLLAKERIDEADWNMTQIGELTDRMAQLGIQLKEFSRKSSDNLDIVSFRGIIDGALEILSPGIRKNKIVVVMKIVPENLEIFVNQLLFQQVIINLISNGMQAMENSDTKELIIEACEKENRVFIIIQDSGNGITAENISRVFEPFFTTKPAGQGLGLGLTITERILKEMNGDITIESCERGARFLITFPAAVSIHGHG